MRMYDLTLILSDRPGALAEAGEALGGAGVNVAGFFGISLNGQGWAHVLVENSAAARRALTGIADVAEEHEVLVVEVDDHVGSLGETCRRVAECGINLRFAYLATGTRLVMASDDIPALERALQLVPA